MARHIVCMTFDFDSLTPQIARGYTMPSRRSRGEFGIIGAQRILALLKKHEIRATWFTPGQTIETYPDAANQVVDAGHEIAHHGWTHKMPSTYESLEEEEADVKRGCETIKSLTGRYPRGYRSPAWEFSDYTLEVLLNNGFDYESSLMGNDYTPYRVRQGDIIDPEQPVIFGPETHLVEMPISWSLDDSPAFEYQRHPTAIQQGLANTNAVLENWYDDFLYMTQTMDWGVITYTCHPQIIGRGHRMMMMDRLIEKLKQHDVAFMAMKDAVDEFSSRAPFAR